MSKQDAITAYLSEITFISSSHSLFGRESRYNWFLPRIETNLSLAELQTLVVRFPIVHVGRA